MIQCSFEEETIFPNGSYRYTNCIDEAEIFDFNDICYGLCYACAYNKLKAKLKTKIKCQV